MTNKLFRHYNHGMFVRKKIIYGKTYYYLVENYREGNKVKQRVLKYIGDRKPTPDELEKMIKGVKK